MLQAAVSALRRRKLTAAGVFAILLAGVLSVVYPVMVRATVPQPLVLHVHGDGAVATRLTAYTPDDPIAVRVATDERQRLDGLTIVAAGPSGERVETTLSRVPDGAFTGMLVLHGEGVWSLRLTSRIGKLTMQTTPVELSVRAVPSYAWLVGAGVGCVVFAVVGGTGLYLLRRMMHRDSIVDAANAVITTRS